MKDFVDTSFSEYFNVQENKLYSKPNKEQNLRKVATATPDEVEKYDKMMQPSSSNNCVHCYDIEILNLFNPELLVINTKPMIKNNLKELLSEFKAQSILVLDYKKRNTCKIFHSSTKLIASNSDIDEAFISMHQSIMTKIKNYARENYDCF